MTVESTDTSSLSLELSNIPVSPTGGYVKSKPKSKLSVKSMPLKNSAENHRVQRNLGERGGGERQRKRIDDCTRKSAKQPFRKMRESTE